MITVHINGMCGYYLCLIYYNGMILADRAKAELTVKVVKNFHYHELTKLYKVIYIFYK